MTRNWTFAQKISIALGTTVVFGIAILTVGIFSLQHVIDAKDKVITVDGQLLIDTQSLKASLEEKVAFVRGYLLSLDEGSLEKARLARAEFVAQISHLKDVVHTEEGRRLVQSIERTEAENQLAVEEVVALRRNSAETDAISRAVEAKMNPTREIIVRELAEFTEHERKVLDGALAASGAVASSAIALMIVIGVSAAVLASVVGVLLARALGRQIGTAVNQVQSSSSELQAAANLQASGAKVQATAVREITTTISELMATSRQIAESAQRVAHIAVDTASAAQTGRGTVEKANESIGVIRQQVDLIVEHMLELGKKSQEIGSVLEIVSELAEQTNILAINATIEAVGAGDTGRRFAAVADEIRKLADRVSGSTKEIRTLIEDVRMAVNTTVMATESGSKAVDAGARESGDVSSAFHEIADLVTTATEAAREIELSTMQQATAVEQVSVAITDVALATKDSETSANQTLQTASLLSSMSKDLLRLIRA